MNYTKGEWKVLHLADEILIADEHNNIIAPIYTLGSGDERFDQENAEANAQLIASAPDLYEACKNLVYQIERLAMVTGYEGEAHFPHLLKAKETLAKVEGKE